MLKFIIHFFQYRLALLALVFCLLASAPIDDINLISSSRSNKAKEKSLNYDFSIRDSSGKKIPFTEFKGKVLFINLWATWCGPCRSEMPTIQQLYNELGNEQVKFVMLSMDTEKTSNKIEGYIKTNAYSFPVYMPSGYLPDQFQVPSIPTTFIISKAGKILVREVGATNFNTPKYKKLIEEESVK